VCASSLLKLISVPDPPSGGRDVTEVRPISLRPESPMVTVAPADGTSTRNEAVPSTALASTS
jgi:hypothetical protein